jgi:hypothetical protein
MQIPLDAPFRFIVEHSHFVIRSPVIVMRNYQIWPNRTIGGWTHTPSGSFFCLDAKAEGHIFVSARFGDGVGGATIYIPHGLVEIEITNIKYRVPYADISLKIESTHEPEASCGSFELKFPGITRVAVFTALDAVDRR